MPKVFAPGQIEQLETEGYCRSMRIFGAQEMAHYLQQLEATEQRDANLAVRMESQPHLLFPWMSELVRNDTFVDPWGDLFGVDLLLTSTSLRRKEPGAGQHAGWHQDTFYIRYDPIWYVCLVALTDQNVENGCLHVIPGSHRWKLLEHADTQDLTSVLTRSQRITEDFDDSGAVPIELKAGEIMFFHPGIVHGSPPNHSSQRRVLMLVEVCPPQTRRVGIRGRATLLRGQDTHGHFDMLSWPDVDCGPGEVDMHQLACKSRVKQMYVGSKRIPPGLT